MKYIYEELGDDQFERLVVLVCRELFGVSVQGFAKGVDGGRDAKFVGVAELFPSKAGPWRGTTIIQAKHTNVINSKFSDPDFFSPTAKTSVLGEELPRILNLRKSSELDNYILFSNRKLGGNTQLTISNYIAAKCNIPVGSIHLCDVEQLDSWIKRFPNVQRLADIDPADSPLTVSPDELANIVLALASGLSQTSPGHHIPTPRTTFLEKNTANNMSDEYGKQLVKRYLKESHQIDAFLADPINEDILRCYETAASEFAQKIISKRKDHQTFDQVFEYLVDLLFSRDSDLRRNKRLTRAILFYMYWTCDIGTTP